MDTQLVRAGSEVMYQSSIRTPLIVVYKVGKTRMEAIVSCLLEFNFRSYYDPDYK